MADRNSDYKYLCVFDMDGTLLDDCHRLSEANISALSELSRAGAAVTLATGRTELMTRQYSSALGIHLPVISSNGALITLPDTGECLHMNAFSGDVLRRILQHNISRQNDYFLYTADRVYHSRVSRRIEIMHLYNASACTDDQIPLTELPGSVDEVMAILPAKGENSVFKALISYQDDDDIRFCNDFKEIEAIQSQTISMDLMPLGSTKGNALAFLAEYLGIGRANIFAFGDQHNDISMLEYAGHAVAPSNAAEEVKAIADFVTSSNNDSGVASAVYNYVLKIIRQESAS
ncbi:MAG: HAD family hydrolase [Saccharofermentanales bacterium]